MGTGPHAQISMRRFSVWETSAYADLFSQPSVFMLGWDG